MSVNVAKLGKEFLCRVDGTLTTNTEVLAALFGWGGSGLAMQRLFFELRPDESLNEASVELGVFYEVVQVEGVGTFLLR